MSNPTEKPEDNLDLQEQKTFRFSVMVVGAGSNKQEAWEDAKESMMRKIADGHYDDFEELESDED